MTPQQIVDEAKRIWALATSTEISDTNAWNLVRNAVRLVETVDYPKGITTSDDSPPKFKFDSTPSAISEQLYIYKAVELFESSEEGLRLLKGTSGVTWKRGPDTISTTGQGRSRMDRLKFYKNEYRRILSRAIKKQNSSNTGNIPDLYKIDDSDLIGVN